MPEPIPAPRPHRRLPLNGMPEAPAGYAACRTMTGPGRQVSHLVIQIPKGGTPGHAVLCGLTRFDGRDAYGKSIPGTAEIRGWSINGGVSGVGVEQVKCAGCWAEAERLGPDSDLHRQHLLRKAEEYRGFVEADLRRIDDRARAEIDRLRDRFPDLLISGSLSWDIQLRSGEATDA